MFASDHLTSDTIDSVSSVIDSVLFLFKDAGLESFGDTTMAESIHLEVQQRGPGGRDGSESFLEQLSYLITRYSIMLYSILGAGVSGIVLVLSAIYFSFFGVYILLWILDYNGITPNHMDTFYETMVHWLQAFERIDTIGYPIRLGKLIIRNLKFHDKYDLSDETFSILFFVLFYPWVFEVYEFYSLPLMFLIPLMMLLYYIDRDMFVYVCNCPTEGNTDLAYEARDGFPLLLTRLYQLTTLLMFNGG